jgi:hypothetical protein
MNPSKQNKDLNQNIKPKENVLKQGWNEQYQKQDNYSNTENKEAGENIRNPGCMSGDCNCPEGTHPGLEKHKI